MAEYLNQAPQQLRTFTAYVRGLISVAAFEDDIATPLWAAMKPHAVAQLTLLEQSIPHLKSMDPAEAHRFSNILEFSKKTLKWSEDEDLTLIEALFDSSEMLLKRLKIAGFIVEPQLSVLTQFLAGITQNPGIASWSGASKYMNRSTKLPELVGHDRTSPEYPTRASAEWTPRTARSVAWAA
jgi:hypothetical protein